MVDTKRVARTLLYYVGLLLVVFLVLVGVRMLLGNVGFWVELVIVIVVAVAYPNVVRELDLESMFRGDE